MNDEKNKKYNIGLDIGTTSVGWAVVECNNQKIIRKGNKKLWGVRLFDNATSAEERRKYRSTRRRYDRRRERIKLLQSEFSEEINKVDSDFFQKLTESKYWNDDVINKKRPLTNDEKIEVKNYQKKYKTIYHLRKKLVDTTEKMDIRLVYLAIHHIIKYRGNFLFSNENFDIKNINIKDNIYNVIDAYINLISDVEIPYDYKEIYASDIDSFVKKINSLQKNDLKIATNELFTKIINKEISSEISKVIVGNKFNVNKILLMNIDKKVEIDFTDDSYEDKIGDILDEIGDKIEILNSLKELYNSVFLIKLFDNYNVNNLSSLMVIKYQEHLDDLKFLKAVFRNDRKIYNNFFRTKKDNICLYDKYIKNEISQDEFIKEINKYLINLLNLDINSLLYKEYNDRVKTKLDNFSFMPRITDKQNGKYPYQLNKDELIKIIENQGKYYPFLLNKTNDNKYRLVKLLEFKIPYYVGPLVSNEESNFAWMERKIDNIKITPFNFDEVIDKEKTAENFIKRMISKCTYLLSEDALPNNSILYCKYKVLNELKQIKVNGERIPIEIQHKIYNDKFLKTKGKITDKVFKDYLNSLPDYVQYEGELTITGYSSEMMFANNMQSYVDFFGKDGFFENTPYTMEDAEKIIEWITIFDDLDILEKKIKDNYPEITNIKSLLNKKYSGWGSLSKKLLNGIYCKNRDDNMLYTIMDLMYNTEENFMQIINNDKYNFQRIIQKENDIDENNKLNYKLVDRLATSPATKKGIYQALKVVKEIVDYMGYDPNNIMIEMARSDDKKERKDNRKNALLKLYKESESKIVAEINKAKYDELIKEMNDYEKIDVERLFLYFLQEGKCLYSGKPLDINCLNEYEVDHIIPRSLIKDDSIDNKALVYRECNQDKADSFVLPSKFRKNDNITRWKHLREVKLMSATKFYRLTRREYSEEDISNFINRQLVETRQITKHVANILNSFYKKTKVVYLKASFTHNYRERYELFKFRDINDYHHAHDAYLTAVLGEYKETYLKKNINFEMIKELNNRIKELGNYEKLKYGYVINSLDNDVSDIVIELSDKMVDSNTGELLFDAEYFNKIVEDTLYRNDILISKKTEIRGGEFYNQTIEKKNSKKINSAIRLKKNMDPSKYGFYTSSNPGYAVMVNYKKNNKIEQRMIGIPIYIVKQKNQDLLDTYIKKTLNINEINDYQIVSKKIPFYSLLNWDGQICYLVGASDKVEVCNAKQFHYDKNFYVEHKHTLNKLFNKKNMEINEELYNRQLTEIINYIVNKIEKEYILFKNLIEELKVIITPKDGEEFSIENKEKIIIELTKLLNCKSDNANFKFLDSKYSSAFGKKHSRIIKNVLIYNQSVTGIKCINEEIKYEF